MKPQFDVAAVEIETQTILWVMGPKDAENADAVIKMAIMRQGVEDRFFSSCQPGQYKAGDKWEGGVELPSPETSEDGRIQKIGGTWYPVGPRGLAR